MNLNLSVRELVYIAFFVVVIMICAQIAIPLPGGVPMTLQIWGISLAGIILGAKNGSIAALVYILLGAAGAPVFANFMGGIGVVLGPTGGFILSFPLMAFAAGIGEGLRSPVWVLAGLVTGVTVNFLAGMLYFSFVMSASLQVAFAAAVLPFIAPAAVMVAVVPVLGRSFKYALAKSGMSI